MRDLLAYFYHYINTIIRLPILGLRHNKIGWLSTMGNHTFLRCCNIGNYCFIGRNCSFNHVEIGNYTCIAANVQIGGMEHAHWSSSISPLLSKDYIFGKQTVIGHDVWIAAGCIIKQGVTIGNGVVIGANSFVNKDVPPYAIVVGSPAKVIKYRDCKEWEEALNKSHYWEYGPKKAKEILNKIKQK